MPFLAFAGAPDLRTQRHHHGNFHALAGQVGQFGSEFACLLILDHHDIFDPQVRHVVPSVSYVASPVTHASQQPFASALTRPIKLARSVTLITPRASNRLNRWLALMQ